MVNALESDVSAPQWRGPAGDPVDRDPTLGSPRGATDGLVLSPLSYGSEKFVRFHQPRLFIAPCAY